MEVEAFLLGEGAADAPRMKLLRISMYKRDMYGRRIYIFIRLVQKSNRNLAHESFGGFTQFHHCPQLLNLRTSDPLLDRLGCRLERLPIGHSLPYPLADMSKRLYMPARRTYMGSALVVHLIQNQRIRPLFDVDSMNKA